MTGQVESVNRDSKHEFSKVPQPSIQLLQGLGVEGDAHAGTTVQHLYLIKKDASKPNLRQVHLIHAELLDEVNGKGFRVQAADLGENILTRGVDLLGLPRGTKLHLGEQAVMEVTGLRNPCSQIENFQTGLLKEMVQKDAGGNPVFRCGIMSVVLTGGEVNPGDAIRVELPAEPHLPLERV